MNRSKGFTLIELLVVIAIIGILSSVVLASLNTARNKGKIAAAKSGMAQLRTSAEIYYDTNGNYGAITDCATGIFADTNFDAIRDNVVKNAHATPAETCTSNNAGAATDSAWAYSVTLVDSTFWCVDSTGASRAATAAAAGNCP
jgi:prepilin-type N-terminal cleavage/methylation domain-containing protein